jgi:protein-S-isoprenylcysteine O-methyltransferase Ste14
MSEHELHHALVLGWIGLSVVLFPFLMFVTAPYGRHLKAGWGPTVSNRVGWILMEAPSPIGMAVLYAIGDNKSSTSLIFLLLWLTHYVHRAFIFPFRLRDSGKRMPVVVMLSGVLFNLVNAYINGRWLFTLAPAYEGSWLADPRFLGGLALFAAGLAINLQSDSILLNLRKPGETGYKVPRGGLFRLVTSPNYFGEIVEWAGWALLTWSLPGAAFALWTAANLVPRARDHHRWYHEKFADYPRERRAVLPFLF